MGFDTTEINLFFYLPKLGILGILGTQQSATSDALLSKSLQLSAPFPLGWDQFFFHLSFPLSKSSIQQNTVWLYHGLCKG